LSPDLGDAERGKARSKQKQINTKCIQRLGELIRDYDAFPKEHVDPLLDCLRPQIELMVTTGTERSALLKLLLWASKGKSSSKFYRHEWLVRAVMKALTAKKVVGTPVVPTVLDIIDNFMKMRLEGEQTEFFKSFMDTHILLIVSSISTLLENILESKKNAKHVPFPKRPMGTLSQISELVKDEDSAQRLVAIFTPLLSLKTCSEAMKGSMLKVLQPLLPLVPSADQFVNPLSELFVTMHAMESRIALCEFFTHLAKQAPWLDQWHHC